MASLKMLFKWWDFDLTPFSTYSWELMGCSLPNTIRGKPVRRPCIEPLLFKDLVRICAVHPDLYILRLAIIWGYMGFLRISNLQ